MGKHDLIGRMNACFNALEQALGALQQHITPLRLLAARVFSLPEIEKGHEHQAIERIAVEQHLGQAARDLALEHYQRLFIHHNRQNVSSKAAVRLPGVICLAAERPEYLALQAQIALINRLKAELEQIITQESGLAPEQRFEFVHTHLHGLITLSAYRTLTLLTNPDSVRFGWANKHVIKNVKRDDVLAQLEKSLKAGRAVPPHTREQWAALVSREIDDVGRLPQHAALKIKRPVKVQPIARVWYQQQQKQVQHPCPLPLIALCQVENGAAVPKIGELLDYDAAAVKHRYKPEARPLRLLVPRLHLYTDAPTR
ncbi:DNA replication terminus site-binding protein [Serratia entomophila]|jgi:DNA replication terminus site-binding protein|uniref:DNA replication terminus site-binding protein n=1 Tax=Serratia entomophila TaxID=42906 RepID=A0ABY5CZC4_9GAMM|nr:DNA replication terminus site-binding protein [Serratia entomophila]UIW20520.1 DNA replication terminus site-binding protein [Serratia entomophila]USV03022.1 DNA replication terminus site-binding protein [Serratia entomophila]CAI0690333.1 DNA replication terminus site-binding protein [Serratia entomophila]CAI0698544.1 DNA replication terminus site-binding protein [Serratia entomophila]CAI0727615.1 DNA replication terminus site-binding protein [Serratia entomophila]